MNDQFDVSLTDDQLLAEVELVTELIMAANASDGPLSQARIDSLLGLEPRVARVMRGREGNS